MHTSQPSHDAHAVLGTTIDAVLREAKKLHRAATSTSLAQALPVLRRLIFSGALEGLSLPELHRRQDMVRRKHILRMLAVEAGCRSWEEYRPTLVNKSANDVEHFDVIRRTSGYPNVWFSSLLEAREFAAAHGGRVIPVREQAVVIADQQGGAT